MLVGLYGGTFDPVHAGHVHAALAVKKALALDQVRMVLAARPGHRGTPGEGTDHRWAMLQIACAEHPGLVADDVELHRTGITYTIDTVMQVQQTQPHAIPCWILGQDAFATLPLWHRWRELLNYCNLVVVDRPGDVRAEPVVLRALCREHETAAFDPHRLGQIVRLAEPMRRVSATEIRRRLAVNEPVEDLLASPVYTYIRQHRLYQSTENTI